MEKMETQMRFGTSLSCIQCSGAVGGQPVLLQPADEYPADSRLELVGSDIDSAPDDARTTVQVRQTRGISIEPGVDAGRVGFQTEAVVGPVYEQRRVGEVALATGRERAGATIVQSASR